MAVKFVPPYPQAARIPPMYEETEFDDLPLWAQQRVQLRAEPVEVEEGDNEYPLHKGGGWYELSNGETVQGEDDAIEAEKALK